MCMVSSGLMLNRMNPSIPPKHYIGVTDKLAVVLQSLEYLKTIAFPTSLVIQWHYDGVTL